MQYRSVFHTLLKNTADEIMLDTSLLAADQIKLVPIQYYFLPCWSRLARCRPVKAARQKPGAGKAAVCTMHPHSERSAVAARLKSGSGYSALFGLPRICRAASGGTCAACMRQPAGVDRSGFRQAFAVVFLPVVERSSTHRRPRDRLARARHGRWRPYANTRTCAPERAARPERASIRARRRPASRPPALYTAQAAIAEIALRTVAG